MRTRQDDGRHHGRELARERQPQHAADRAGQAQLGKLAHKLRRPFTGLVRALKQRVENPHGTRTARNHDLMHGLSVALECKQCRHMSCWPLWCSSRHLLKIS